MEAYTAVSPQVETLETLKRIEKLLERLVETYEHMDETQSYQAALERWRMGQGKHPDD